MPLIQPERLLSPGPRRQRQTRLNNPLNLPTVRAARLPHRRWVQQRGWLNRILNGRSRPSMTTVQHIRLSSQPPPPAFRSRSHRLVPMRLPPNSDCPRVVCYSRIQTGRKSVRTYFCPCPEQNCMSDDQPTSQPSAAPSSGLSAEMMAALAAATGLVGSFVYAVVFAPIAIALGYMATQKATPKRWPTWVGWATIVISTLNFVAWLIIFVPTLP